MKDTIRTVLSVGLLQLAMVGVQLPCHADSVESSESTAEIKAYAPKYRERINTYEGQITTALSKGWLTAVSAQKFKDRLSELKTLEANARANGYPKPELDKVEKAFTQFNIDLTAAEQTPAKTVSKSAGPGN